MTGKHIESCACVMNNNKQQIKKAKGKYKEQTMNERVGKDLIRKMERSRRRRERHKGSEGKRAREIAKTLETINKIRASHGSVVFGPRCARPRPQRGRKEEEGNRKANGKKSRKAESQRKADRHKERKCPKRNVIKGW